MRPIFDQSIQKSFWLPPSNELDRLGESVPETFTLFSRCYFRGNFCQNVNGKNNLYSI